MRLLIGFNSAAAACTPANTPSQSPGHASDKARGGNLLGSTGGAVAGTTHEAAARSNDAQDGAKKKKRPKYTQSFDSSHFAIPTGAISGEQQAHRRTCTLEPAVTSWGERRAPMQGCRGGGHTQLIHHWNRQVVAHDQREFLPRDSLGLAGPGTFPPPGSLQVVSGRVLPPRSDRSAPQPSNQQFCWSLPESCCE